MQKCVKCRVIFHDDVRERCLYCNALLSLADQHDVEIFKRKPKKLGEELTDEDDIIEEAIEKRTIIDLGQTRYFVANYFQMRTLKFIYEFHRNEFKRGKEYKRILIQPLRLSSFLILPWVFVNLVDSLFFRFMYNGFCSKCGWKYQKRYRDREHDRNECEYNLEYDSILSDVVKDEFGEKEKMYKEEAKKKIKEGRRSAYFHLCSGRSGLLEFFDICCILSSMAAIIAVGVNASYSLIYLFVYYDMGTNGLYFR